ncbi:N-acetylmuramoyl-L-alanine amidase [Chitinophaga pendula]|uniref:N-acetylmuramoyl-L-alanine amidase n=1 Tax=Chitinophaga TaxID=79328 RepID=UPI000BAF8CA5|nr:MULTISPECIES: N-acetylmuramoyl-L-alanine amidase [Chitinophaga]ASZ14501.1 N-acetylmuramoyl-L-alanine amidase [Chitinophaga sp. MD30]UCJ07842.1 N-acetylmuramoyl-L-alanine amidase [Chitinophaga pendula]
MRRIDYIVIHCTATQPTATIEAIQRYWRTPKPFGQGWKSPGYHYIIKASGEIVQLSSECDVTNGVAGHNANSIHVSYIGGVDKTGKIPEDTRTPEQLEAMKTIITDLHSKYPKAKILGHRDFKVPKACPSFEVSQWLKQIGI